MTLGKLTSQGLIFFISKMDYFQNGNTNCIYPKGLAQEEMSWFLKSIWYSVWAKETFNIHTSRVTFNFAEQMLFIKSVCFLSPALTSQKRIMYDIGKYKTAPNRVLIIIN